MERNLETKEGTAHLVEYLGATAALELNPEGTRDAVVSTLEQDLARYGGDLGSRYYRWRAYGTGAAMGLILGDLGASWQTEVATGAALDALLNRAARIPASGSLLTAARAQFGYNELLQTAERNARSAIGDSIAAFFALEPYRIIIEIGGKPGVQPSLSFSPGIAGIVRPAPSLSILNRAERASMTNPSFDVSIKGRPVMIDGRTAPLYILVVLLPSPVKLNGARATDVRAPDPAVIYQVSGEGTEIVLRGSALESIAVTASSMTIRLRAQ